MTIPTPTNDNTNPISRYIPTGWNDLDWDLPANDDVAARKEEAL